MLAKNHLLLTQSRNKDPFDWITVKTYLDLNKKKIIKSLEEEDKKLESVKRINRMWV